MESRCNQNEDCMDGDGEGFDESDCRVVYLDEKQYRFAVENMGFYQLHKVGQLVFWLRHNI